MTRRLLAPAALGAVSVLALAGCAGGTTAGDADATSTPAADALTVVASTNVYGQIVSEIGGDHVDVTSIVSSSAQDPHSYEPSAQDQLTISEADLIIENGGGYDAFIDALIESSGSSAPVITAAEYSHDFPGAESHDEAHADETASPAPTESEEDHAHEGEDHAHEEGDGHDHIEGFNEHVWYDPHTMEDLAEGIAAELSELAPEHAADFEANATAFVGEIGGLEDSLAEIEAADAGAGVFVTEPVPVYLIEAAGLENVTPSEFSESVEEGQDVPPATLLEAMQLIDSGDVRVVIVNPQTGGAETTQVVGEADGKGVPVIEFAETLPEGQTYISWMQENIAALAGALGE